MKEAHIATSSGAFAVVGGLAVIAASVVHASQPRGCVGDECDTLPMRDATTATSLLAAIAGLMIVVSAAGLLAWIRRRNGLAWPGRLGAALCVLGLASWVSAVAIQELVYEGDFPWMPAFVVPGLIALAAGVALVGWTVLRSRVLPTWSGVALVASALLLLGANEQTSSILLAIPFGLAWAVTGIVLILRGPGATATPTSPHERPA